MATYNFTVRAIDNTGAFADRNFAMTVNNTQVDRFIIASQTGIARSQDGVTWNTEPGLTFEQVRWENNQWIGYSTSLIGGFDSVRTSVDGLNWKRNQQVVPPRVAYTGGATFYGWNLIKFRKGQWWGWAVIYVNSASFYIDEYVSNDLVNWTSTARSLNAFSTGNNSGMGVVDVDYDPVSDTWVLLQSSYGNGGVIVYRRTGNATWTSAGQQINGPTFSGATAVLETARTNATTSTKTGKVFFQNGLWIIALGAAGVWTSVDALNWTFRDFSAINNLGVANVVFSNGRLLAFPMSTTATVGGGSPLYQSVNAGHTWALRPSSGYITPGLFATNQANRQNIAAYAGTLVAISPGATNPSVSKDDGTTWTQVQSMSLMGIGTTPICVASRET